MWFSSIVTLSFAAVVYAFPFQSRTLSKPPAFFLAGDSTTAVQSWNGGGWGDGFLTTLQKGAFGINYGVNGATTVTYKNESHWATVLSSVEQYKKEYDPYVTIQFGHNDQKVDKNISVADFENNLTNFVSDVRKAGGTPILVTSLSRRSFSTSTGQIALNLAVQVASTIKVAGETGSKYIDLNKESMAYLNAIGQDAAWQYNLLPADRTHLNYPGSVVFGNLVASLIVKANVGKGVKKYFDLDKTIIKAIDKGVFIFPNVTVSEE